VAAHLRGQASGSDVLTRLAALETAVQKSASNTDQRLERIEELLKKFADPGPIPVESSCPDRQITVDRTVDRTLSKEQKEQKVALSSGRAYAAQQQHMMQQVADHDTTGKEPAKNIVDSVLLKTGFVDREWFAINEEQHHLRRSWIGRLASKIVATITFEFVSMLVLVVYAVALGAETTQGPDRDTVMDDADIVFLAYFVFEVTLRILADSKGFLCEPWNLIDLAVVLIGLVETVMGATVAGQNTNMQAARVMRVFRFMRVLRVIRVVRAFRELRLILQGLVASMKTLVWLGFFLLIVMYVFAILLVQLLVDHRDERLGGWHPTDPEGYKVSDLFGSIGDSMFTLFQILTLESWAMGIVRPVMHYAPWSLMLFIPYIFFTTFAVLNVVTGVFVEQTQAAAADDDRNIVKAQMQHMKQQVGLLKELFAEADADQSGEISLEEFYLMVDDERAKAYFARLGISPHEAITLFHLVDQDGSGAVNVDEFIFGVIRVHGGPKAMDLVSMTYDLQQMSSVVSSMAGQVEQMHRHVFPTDLPPPEHIEATDDPEMGQPPVTVERSASAVTAGPGDTSGSPVTMARKDQG